MTTETPLKKPLHRHMQFAVSACVGVVALAIALVLRTPLAFSIGANAFFAAYTVIVVAQMPLLTGRYLSKNARATDQPVLVIFAVTLIVVAVAIISLFQLINRAPCRTHLRAAVDPARLVHHPRHDGAALRACLLGQ